MARNKQDAPAANPQQRAAARKGPALRTEYGHSSGDRNSRTDEQDWTRFEEAKDEAHKQRPDPATRKSRH